MNNNEEKDMIQKCSECFIEYLNTKTDESLNRFVSLFSQLPYEDMKEVVLNADALLNNKESTRARK